MNDQTHLGFTHDGHPISIPQRVRVWHTAILGATGVGKSTLIENMVAQDMARGDGILLLDPHGPLATKSIELVPPERTNHVCLFDPGDREFPIGWNPLDERDPLLHAKIASGVTTAIKWLWPDSWGPRLENLLCFGAETLLATPGASFAQLHRLISDDDYRERCINFVHNTTTRNFWHNDYATWSEQEKREARAPVMNKINQFLFFPEILHVLAQPSSTLRLDVAMAKRRIIIANLAKGTTSDAVAYLIGSLLLSRALAVGFARANAPLPLAPAFHIYVDEAQAFAPKILRSIITDARKLNISLTLATQSLSELDDGVRAAIMANVGTRVCFQLSPDDAALFAPLLNREHQTFNPHRLTQLGVGEAYVKMRGEHGGDAHHLFTQPSPERRSDPENVRKQSRQHYARARDTVAAYIARVTSHGQLKVKSRWVRTTKRTSRRA